MNETNQHSTPVRQNFTRVWAVVRHKLETQDKQALNMAEALHEIIVAEWDSMDALDAAEEKEKLSDHYKTENSRAAIDPDLRRAAEIEAIYKARENQVEQYLAEEAAALNARLLEKYVPLLQQMIDAGLLAVGMWRDEGDVADYLRDEYRFVAFETARLYVNGPIHLCAGQSFMSVPNQETSDTTSA